MDIETLRDYCLAKKGTNESFPFDETTLVFKVLTKMYALIDLESNYINLKCEPEKAIELRETFQAVSEGYHMSKKHWNTIQIQSSIPSSLLLEWIDDSYNLVVKGLTKAQKEELKTV